MSVHLGAGWRLIHLTDRCIELRKDDAAYRRVLGRDGFVELSAEPGMDRNALIEKAKQMAQESDARLADVISRQIVLRSTGRYQRRQRELSHAFETPEAPRFIGVKRP